MGKMRRGQKRESMGGERKTRRRKRHFRGARERRKRLSRRFAGLKWRFGMYVPICLVLSFVGSYIIGITTNYVQEWCIDKYEGETSGKIQYDYELWYDEEGILHYDFVGRPYEHNSRFETVYGIISFMQVLLVPAWILFSVAVTGKLFYDREMKKPIDLLLNASRQIADNQLDFKLEYDKPNELGMLCKAFDDMRSALYDGNRQLWRSLEERRRLNSAFSHDLRTPLTVLRGYVDFLEKYTPDGNVSAEKLQEVLAMMSGQITRLEHYTQKMNSVQKLEDIVPKPEAVSAEQLKSTFYETGRLLCTGKRFELDWQGGGVLWLDMELALQIYENLVSNACRYAAERVLVECAAEGNSFRFTVGDDGNGFSKEALRNASEPFFRDEKEPDKTHFGLGLYISRILCEKCGGSLVIENGTGGADCVCGGRVTARFGSV